MERVRPALTLFWTF